MQRDLAKLWDVSSQTFNLKDAANHLSTVRQMNKFPTIIPSFKANFGADDFHRSPVLSQKPQSLHF